MEEKRYTFYPNQNLEGYRLCHLDNSRGFTTMNCYAIYKDDKTGYVQYKLMLKNRIDKETREDELRELKCVVRKGINSNFNYSKGILDIDVYYKTLFIMFHFSVADAMPTADEVLNLMRKVQETLADNGF